MVSQKIWKPFSTLIWGKSQGGFKKLPVISHSIVFQTFRYTLDFISIFFVFKYWKYQDKMYWAHTPTKKLLQNQSSTESLHYVFVIGDHPAAALDIFADSSGKFPAIESPNGGQKGQAQWQSIHISKIVLWRLSSKITNHACIQVQCEKLCQTEHYKTLSMPCWQSRKNITTCVTRFQHFDLLINFQRAR